MKKAVFIFLFLVAYFGFYLAVFPGDFHYDDYHSIRSNARLVSPENIPRFFTDPTYFSVTPRGAMYRPVLLASYALDFQAYGWRAWGWHLTNLLMHLVNVLLVWILIKGIFRAERPAWVAALVYAFSPVAGENINYISCRSSILVTAFMLSGLLAVRKYMAAKEKGGAGAGWIFVCCLLFIVGLLSKDSNAVFPGMALLYFWIFSKEPNREKLVQAFYLIIPLALILAGYLFLRWTLFDSVFARETSPRPRLLNLYTEMKAYFWYVYLFLFPVGVSIEHSFKLEPGLGSWRVLSSLTGLLVMLNLVVYSLFRPRSGIARFGFLVGFYILALLPTTGIIPLNVLVSERALYPALFGLTGIFSIFMDKVFEKKRATAFCAFALILACYVSLLFERGRVWQSEWRLWSNAFNNAPDNPRVMGELGRKYFAENQNEKALRYILKSNELHTGEPTTYFNLGTIYMDMGSLDDAEKYFRKGLDLDPEDSQARVNLAEVYAAQGKISMARYELEQAIAIDGNSSLAHSNLGDLYFSEGDFRNAESEFREALRLDPKLELAHYNLALVLSGRGAYLEALGHFQKAHELNGGNLDNMLWIGIMHLKLGDPALSKKWMEKALAMDSRYYVAWYYLGLAEKGQGKKEAAVDALKKSLEFNPGDEKIKKETRELLQKLAQ